MKGDIIIDRITNTEGFELRMTRSVLCRIRTGLKLALTVGGLKQGETFKYAELITTVNALLEEAEQ